MKFDKDALKKVVIEGLREHARKVLTKDELKQLTFDYVGNEAVIKGPDDLVKKALAALK